MGKLDGKASEMVFWVCKQIEGAVMRSKNVANKQKTETLALGLGREKRSEEILRYSHPHSRRSSPTHSLSTRYRI